MELEIVPLIACIRVFGVHRTLDHHGVNIPTADAFLAGHGFRINDAVTDVEIDCMSVPGKTLGQAVAHVHDVECRVDAALAGWS